MLRDEIKTITGNKRRFFLLRIADMDTRTALFLCNIRRGTYNTWLLNQEFVELYRRREELSAEYKQEALQLLRRDNQFEAVLLEGKIIKRMKDELESGEYELIRTNLAREVYSRLLSDLDTQPQTKSLTWEQRISQLFITPAQEITEGETINGELVETNNSQETEHTQSLTLSESQ
ncbi:MAG: hypothetical protein ACXABY_14380 [Candidatus Thorarchaeota archaeon]|jgi:hypothetical protein